MPELMAAGRGKLLALVCAAVLVEGIAAAVTALATRLLFVDLHSGAGLDPVWLFSLPLAGLFIATARIAARASGEAVGQSYIRDARIAFFDHHSQMSKSDLARIPRGYLSLRFVGDMGAIGRWFGEGLPQVLGAFVLVPTALVVLVVIEPTSGVFIVPLVIACAVVILASSGSLRNRHADIRSRRAAIAARMAERLEQAAHLRLAGRVRKERNALFSKSARLISASIRRARAVETLRALPELTLAVGVTVLFVVGSASGTGPGGIAGGIAALAIAVAPLRRLATIMDWLSAYRVAEAKLRKALDRRIVSQPDNGGVRLDGPIGVELRSLTLGPLHEVTANLPAGQWGTLRGRSGSGKSLLLSALAGMERPEAGDILLSGHSVTQVSPGTLRHRIALVSSECPILRGSMRRTLTLARRDRPTDKRLTQVILRVGLEDLVDRIGGLDGKIDEGGRSLATGERIRLSMAQAMLAKPGLVLIDDIWPFLDVKSRETFCVWLMQTGATVLVSVIDTAMPISFSGSVEIKSAPGVGGVPSGIASSLPAGISFREPAVQASGRF